MESISVFDIFKIGVGPSSSHTMGPWKAALDFIGQVGSRPIDSIRIYLYGSLSKTGKGHATDKAVQLGLEGYEPRTISTESINSILENIRENTMIRINGTGVSFDPESDLIFTNQDHIQHPNTIRFIATINNSVVFEMTYASVGGGFIENSNMVKSKDVKYTLPYPVNKGKELLNYTDEFDISISTLSLRNELALREATEIRRELDAIMDVMIDSVYRGCSNSGVLPGGLNVLRRAKLLCQELTNMESFDSLDEWKAAVRNSNKDFNAINKWVSCFALAVNEENASLGRVVTSPTNGAAGVIPAVILYYYFFCDYKDIQEIRNFLFTAGEIGCLFKKGATISAAVGGCQAEIGVSSAMAAAGLTEVLGGTPRQCLMAAEIAMEHHLGMTCDPIGGLVQIPCIERNAMGAIKAITAANLALSSDPYLAKVHLDTVIKTMWDTAQDMNSKYKETAEGGLAFNLPILIPNC